jgi:hypothetical protein
MVLLDSLVVVVVTSPCELLVASVVVPSQKLQLSQYSWCRYHMSC